MSIWNIILLGTYLAGVVGLVLGLVIRLGLPLGAFTAAGALRFAATCFLCSLATREVAAAVQKPKEEPKGKAAAA